MQRITRDLFDQVTLSASLQRLDIMELEERLEFSPLLVEAGLPATSRIVPDLCCDCKMDRGYPFPDIQVGDPALDGMGTTGTTSGRPLT